MWWKGCEFRGGNRVQRGKYPGFQTDSEGLFVTCRTPRRHAPVMELKKASEPDHPSRAPDPSRSRSRGKIAATTNPVDRLGRMTGAKTRVIIERISNPRR